MISFTVLGVAQPKGSARAFMPKGARFPVVTSANPNLKGWEDSIRAALQEHAAGHFFDGPVRVRIIFELPRAASLPKRVIHHLKAPDVDKLARGSLDAMKGVLWKDDSQVIELHVTKRYSQGQPCAHIEVGTAVEVLLAAPEREAELGRGLF